MRRVLISYINVVSLYKSGDEVVPGLLRSEFRCDPRRRNARNILRSEDPERPVMSVTPADFGFPCFADTEEDLARPQRSEPWEAPECRSHQYFALRDAKKPDMHSFGLLCMWLFFKDKTLSQWGHTSAEVHTAFMDRDSHAFEDLQYNKRSPDDLVLQPAKALVKSDSSLQSEIRIPLDKSSGLL